MWRWQLVKRRPSGSPFSSDFTAILANQVLLSNKITFYPHSMFVLCSIQWGNETNVEEDGPERLLVLRQNRDINLCCTRASHHGFCLTFDSIASGFMFDVARIYKLEVARLSPRSQIPSWR